MPHESGGDRSAQSAVALLPFIARYRTRIWTRKLRSRRGLGAAAGAFSAIGYALICLFILWFSNVLTGAAARQSPGSEGGLLLVPFGLLLALTLLSGVSVALNELFVSTDVELLLTAPVGDATLFLLKLFDCTLPVWPTVGWALCAIAGYGTALGLTPGFYAVSLSACVLLGIAVSTLDLLAVLLVARIVPPKRLREGVLLLSSLLGVTVWILFNAGNQRRGFAQSSVRRLTTLSGGLTWTPLGWAASAAGAGADGRWGDAALDLARLALFLAVSGVAAYAVFRLVFLPGWSAAHEVSVRRRHRRARSTRDAPGSVALAIAAKEWRTTRRDIPYLSSLLPSVIYAVLFPVFLLRLPTGSTLATRWLGIAGIVAVPMLLGPTPSLAAIGREGASFEALRASPLRALDLLLGKIIAVSVPVGLLTALAGALLAALRHAPFTAGLVACLGGAWLGLGCAVAGVSIGAIHPNFEAAASRRRANPSSAGCLLYALIAGLFCLGSAGVVAAAAYAVLRPQVPAAQRLGYFALAGIPFAAGVAAVIVVAAIGLARTGALLDPQE